MKSRFGTGKNVIELASEKIGLRASHIRVALAVLAAALIVLAAYYIFFAHSSQAFSVSASSEATSATVAKQKQTTAEPEQQAVIEQPTVTTAVVYVTGAVQNPGLYSLDTSRRVGDAVAAAGGMTPDAIMQAVNLAEFISDGLQIHIPKTEEEVVVPDSSKTSASSGNVTASSSSKQGSGKVNINTADSAALQTLTGIGAATAQKIIDYRKANGSFKSKEELKNVSGIGEKKYAAIEALITA